MVVQYNYSGFDLKLLLFLELYSKSDGHLQFQKWFYNKDDSLHCDDKNCGDTLDDKKDHHSKHG